MAFDKYLAYRSQGINPSMYSDDRAESMRMMNEDMAARWEKDRAGFQKAMLDQRILERQGKGNAAPEEQPQQAAHQAQQAQRGGGNQMGDAPMQWPGMDPAAHFGAHKDMISATNEAWSREMDSRREQAAAERDRQHEYEMESLKKQVPSSTSSSQTSSKPSLTKSERLETARSCPQRDLVVMPLALAQMELPELPIRLAIAPLQAHSLVINASIHSTATGHT